MNIETLAGIVHNNIAEHIKTLRVYGSDFLTLWNDAPQPIREMEIEMTKLNIRHNASSPEMNFSLWYAWCLQHGWKPGPLNPEKKTSPRLRPWESLAKSEKQISDIAISTVRLYRSDVLAEYAYNGNGPHETYNIFGGPVHRIDQYSF